MGLFTWCKEEWRPPGPSSRLPLDEGCKHFPKVVRSRYVMWLLVDAVETRPRLVIERDLRGGGDASHKRVCGDCVENALFLKNLSERLVPGPFLFTKFPLRLCSPRGALGGVNRGYYGSHGPLIAGRLRNYCFQQPNQPRVFVECHKHFMVWNFSARLPQHMPLTTNTSLVRSLGKLPCSECAQISTLTFQ